MLLLPVLNVLSARSREHAQQQVSHLHPTGQFLTNQPVYNLQELVKPNVDISSLYQGHPVGIPEATQSS